jgi:hypothetical protein
VVVVAAGANSFARSRTGKSTMEVSMTLFLKHAMVAVTAAAFAIALASPGQARQDNMQRYDAANQQVNTPYDTAGNRDMAVEGYRAYAYVPGPANWADCSQSPASSTYVPCPSN